MRLTFLPHFVRVGNVDIYELARVTELDAGLLGADTDPNATIFSGIPMNVENDFESAIAPNTTCFREDGILEVAFSPESLQIIEKDLAIVVPVMNEEHSIFAGVLKGIPHHCLIIVVSNSEAESFEVESSILGELCIDTGRRGVAIHQQDPGLAKAFTLAGLPQVVSEHGRLRNGKGEAMMIGTALAKVAGRKFVGFIDADNLVPGAVHEYGKAFAAGLRHILDSSSAADDDTTQDLDPTALGMVRLKWKSKPKIVDGKLVATESGRCSTVVNEWMNKLLASMTGDCSPSDLIKTANAGDHAMSIDLALQLSFATGYAVEPFQLIDLWEHSGFLPPTPPSTSVASSADRENLPFSSFPVRVPRVKILQIETINPHIHDFGKGPGHVSSMQAQGLTVIQRSRLTPPGLKGELEEYLGAELGLAVDRSRGTGKLWMYPPMRDMDFRIFGNIAKQEAGTMRVFG